MTKKLNEAAVTLDIAGLQSGDMEMLSKILHLAGVAEAPAEENEISMEPDVDTSPDVGLGLDGMPVLASPEEDEFSEVPDMEEIPDEVPAEDEFSEVPDEEGFDAEEADDGFDMDRLRKLSGINPIGGIGSLGESLLPDLTLGEDATEERDLEFGPFSTEDECIANAEEKTNGIEGDNFVVVIHANRYYWRRTMTEDAAFRPEGSEYDTTGAEHSRHAFERVPGTAPGDNGLRNRVNEEEEVDECDETVESLHESLVQRYRKYIGE